MGPWDLRLLEISTVVDCWEIWHARNCFALYLCRFHSINPNAFEECQSIKEVDLSGNDLTSVPSQALNPLIHLSTLRISNNKIRILHDQVFRDLPLELLDIGRNHVPLQIQAKAFCGLEPRISHLEAGIRFVFLTLSLIKCGEFTINVWWDSLDELWLPCFNLVNVFMHSNKELAHLTVDLMAQIYAWLSLSADRGVNFHT